MRNDKLNFFMPLSFEKAKDKEGKDYIKINGIASTNDQDSDDEILEPSGFNVERLKKFGLINFNHNQKDILGHVTDAKIQGNKLYLDGVLYPEIKDIDRIIQTAKILEKKGQGRKLGWSIEGKARKRDPFNPKHILQADLHGVALTFTPKNYNTFATIVKGEYEEDYIEYEYDESATTGKEYILDIERADGTRVMVDKDFNIVVKKAMLAGSATGRELNNQDTSGAALKQESLDKRLKKLTPKIGEIKTISKNIHKFNDKGHSKIKKGIEKFLYS